MMLERTEMTRENWTNLRVVSDPALHGASSIVMLNSESNKRSKSTVIFWYGALNLQFFGWNLNQQDTND